MLELIPGQVGPFLRLNNSQNEVFWLITAIVKSPSSTSFKNFRGPSVSFEIYMSSSPLQRCRYSVMVKPL